MNSIYRNRWLKINVEYCEYDKWQNLLGICPILQIIVR